jgi:hypothetical protein
VFPESFAEEEKKAAFIAVLQMNSRMTATTMSTRPEADLGGRVLDAVRAGTWGQLRDLRVALAGNAVTVAGIAPTYYVKQLALEAARLALRESRLRLQLEITVDVT